MMSPRTILITAVCLLVCAGCSDDYTEVISQPSASSVTSDVTDYFPLDEGYVTEYVVRSGMQTETISFEVGKVVVSNDGPLVAWFSYEGATRDTSYLLATSSALYYYETFYSDPEKILQFPLLPGNSWNRWGSDPKNDTIAYDYNFDFRQGFEDKFGINLGDPGGAQKSFPTQGGSTMLVEGVERVELESGKFFSNAVRIAIEQSSGSTNYYWFSAGIGMIRYSLETTDANYPDGVVVGEINNWYHSR
jgi:hypothetical protein